MKHKSCKIISWYKMHGRKQYFQRQIMPEWMTQSLIFRPTPWNWKISGMFDCIQSRKSIGSRKIAQRMRAWLCTQQQFKTYFSCLQDLEWWPYHQKPWMNCQRTNQKKCLNEKYQVLLWHFRWSAMLAGIKKLVSTQTQSNKKEKGMTKMYS